MRTIKKLLLTSATILLLVGFQDKPNRHFELGDRYYEKGRYDDAILEYRAVFRMMSSNLASMPREQLNTVAKAHYNLAVSYYRKRWIDEERGEADTALSLWP